MYIKHIHQLLGILPLETKRLDGSEMSKLGCLHNAWIRIEAGRIKDFGSMEVYPVHSEESIDASGKIVLPSFIDSHTHLVFAAYRAHEFVDRIKGLSYADIAAKGGGILNSASKMAALDEDVLYEQSLLRLEACISAGTGAIEIKSGYGLDLENELKMLRVIQRLKKISPIPIKATFLGAHAYPLPFKEDHNAYLDLLVNQCLPIIEKEGLAEYIDVFCEHGFFSIEESRRIIQAGRAYGLKAKIHANQLHHSGGVELGVEEGILSVDHLECVAQSEINALKGSTTIGTLLPGAAFFLGMHYQPARAMIDGGLGIAIASDFNPGSCPIFDLHFMASLACTQLKMTPEETINALTINAAYAMELSDSHGSITVGKQANLIITKAMDHFYEIPYLTTHQWIDSVIVNGNII